MSDQLEYTPKSKGLPPEELVEILRQAVRRARVQRNNYEQELMKMTKRAIKAETELALLEKYVNRVSKHS